MEGYNIFKVREAVRAEIKADSIESEFNHRLKKVSAQNIKVDMDGLLQQVEDDLTRMSNVAVKDYTVVWDQVNKRFMVDSPRGKGEVCMSLIHNIFEEEIQFEVIMPSAFFVQPLLTSYIEDKNALHEPFALDNKVTLGKRCVAGKNPTAATITIKNEDVSSKEILNHLAKNKVVHSIGLDYDGIVFFNLDHTFMFTAITYEADLKYKSNGALDPQDDFVAEFTPILPELSKVINLLVKDVDGVS